MPVDTNRMDLIPGRAAATLGSPSYGRATGLMMSRATEGLAMSQGSIGLKRRFWGYRHTSLPKSSLLR